MSENKGLLSIDLGITEKDEKDKWATPWAAYFWALNYFDFPVADCKTAVLDCAASAENAKSGRFLTEQDDCLAVDWDSEYCWLNPPYSNPLPFVQKAVEQMRKGKKIILLLNADTSTKWFKEIQENAAEIVFVTEGRVSFLHYRTGKEVKGNNKPQMFAYLDCSKGGLETNYFSIVQIKRVAKVVEDYHDVANGR